MGVDYHTDRLFFTLNGVWLGTAAVIPRAVFVAAASSYSDGGGVGSGSGDGGSSGGGIAPIVVVKAPPPKMTQSQQKKQSSEDAWSLADRGSGLPTVIATDRIPKPQAAAAVGEGLAVRSMQREHFAYHCRPRTCASLVGAVVILLTMRRHELGGLPVTFTADAARDEEKKIETGLLVVAPPLSASAAASAAAAAAAAAEAMTKTAPSPPTAPALSVSRSLCSSRRGRILG